MKRLLSCRHMMRWVIGDIDDNGVSHGSSCLYIAHDMSAVGKYACYICLITSFFDRQSRASRSPAKQSPLRCYHFHLGHFKSISLMASNNARARGPPLKLATAASRTGINAPRVLHTKFHGKYVSHRSRYADAFADAHCLYCSMNLGFHVFAFS